MLDYKTKLSDDVAHILTEEFCAEIIRSQNFDDVCEGDCVACRTQYIMKLIALKTTDLKRNAVICDHNIRYKLDKTSFDKLIESMG